MYYHRGDLSANQVECAFPPGPACLERNREILSRCLENAATCGLVASLEESLQTTCVNVAPLRRCSDKGKLNKRTRSAAMDLWLGCDQCPRWYRASTQLYSKWKGRFFSCAKLGEVCTFDSDWEDDGLQWDISDVSGTSSAAKFRKIIEEEAVSNCGLPVAIPELWIGCEMCPRWYRVNRSLFSRWEHSLFSCCKLGEACNSDKGWECWLACEACFVPRPVSFGVFAANHAKDRIFCQELGIRCEPPRNLTGLCVVGQLL